MALNNLGLGFLITARDQATGPLRRVGGSFRTLDRSSSLAMGSMVAGAAGLTVGLTALAGGVGLLQTAFGGAFRAGAEFQQAIAEVETLLPSASRDTGAMREQVLGLVAQFGGTPQEQARALYQTISGGITDAAQATEFLGQANRLAVAGVTDTNTATEALLSTLNGYSLGAGEAQRASDLLFSTVRFGRTTVGELSSQLGRVAPAASNLGVSLEEMFAALGAGTRSLGTNRTVTGLIQSFQNIKRPTAEATAEARRLGIEFSSTALRSQGLASFLGNIQNSANFSAESFERLFGSAEASNAIVAIMAENGGRLNAALEAMGASAGATSEAYNQMKSTIENVLKRLQGAFNIFKVRAAEVFSVILQPLFSLIEKGLELFNGMPPAAQRGVVGFIAIAGAALVTLGAMTALIGAFLILLPFFKILLITAAAVAALFFFVLLPAIATVATAIAGFFVAFDNNVGGIGDRTGAVIDKIKLFFAGLKQIFTDGFLSGETAEQLLQEENRGVVRFLLNVVAFIERVKIFFKGLQRGFKAFVSQMQPAFERLWGAFENLGKAMGFVGDGMEDAAGTPADRVASMGERVGKVLGGAFKSIVGGITNVVNMWTFMSRSFASGRLRLRFVVLTIKDFFLNAFDSIGLAMDRLIVKLAQLASHIPPQLRPDFVDDLIQAGQGAATSAARRETDIAGRDTERGAVAAQALLANFEADRALDNLFGGDSPAASAEVSARAQAQNDSLDAAALKFAQLIKEQPIQVSTTVEMDGATVGTSIETARRGALADAGVPVGTGA